MKINIGINRRPNSCISRSNQSTKNWTTLDGPKFNQALNNLFGSFRQVMKISIDEPDRDTFPGFVNTFADPMTYHRVIMDLASVIMWPYPGGTLLLNANPDFILNHIPKNGPFRLGYASASGGADESINHLFQDKIIPTYEQSDLSIHGATALFVSIISNNGNGILGETAEAFPVGMDVQEYFDILCIGKSGGTRNKPFISVGFAEDPDVGERARVSILSFHKEQE